MPSADNKSVTATITSDEEIQTVEGWTLSEDRKSISKVYTKSANEVIEVQDLAGNTSQATVTVTISGNNGGNGGGGNSGGDSENNNGGNNGGSSNNGGSGSNAGGSSGSKSSSSNVDDTTANSSIPKTGESFRNIGFILLGISLVEIVWTKIKKNNDIDE